MLCVCSSVAYAATGGAKVNVRREIVLHRSGAEAVRVLGFTANCEHTPGELRWLEVVLVFILFYFFFFFLEKYKTKSVLCI